MAITPYPYFYDLQLKRFLMQAVRAFSGFQYATGSRNGDDPVLKIVPCKTASRNRMTAAIQRNLSANTLLTVPMIAVDFSDLKFVPDMLQNPHFKETIHLIERAKDELTGEYLTTGGRKASVERMMPRPFEMSLQVDIWTSNQDQKHQLLEQILPMVAPTFEIQNSDNALDWTALTTAYFEDMELSSITIPVGESDEIDIASLKFRVPMWLTPPALLRKQQRIHEVITNINEGEEENGVLVSGDNLVQHVTTPGNHSIKIDNGTLTLLGGHGGSLDQNGDPYEWASLFDQYGITLMPGETQIKIRYDLNTEDNDITGTVQPTGDPDKLDWQIDIDTLPANTLSAINGVIDPTRSFPGEGNLPAPANGQRYLIVNDLAQGSTAWGSITAKAGSIIQRVSGNWVVSFNAATNSSTTHYVLNQMSGSQLRWQGNEWVMALAGVIAAGYWRIN